MVALATSFDMVVALLILIPRFLTGRNDRVSSEPSSYRCGYSYSFDRLLAEHRHRSEPAVAVALLPAHDGVELPLDRLGDGANSALAHIDQCSHSRLAVAAENDGR